MSTIERILKKFNQTGDFSLAMQLLREEDLAKLAEHYRSKGTITFFGIDEAPVPAVDLLAEMKAPAEVAAGWASKFPPGPIVVDGVAEFTRKAVEVLQTMDLSKFHVPGTMLTGGADAKMLKRVDDETRFDRMFVDTALTSLADYEWEIYVRFHDIECTRFECALNRKLATVQMGSVHTEETVVATSMPFKRCEAAVLWAHKFDVPVFVRADILHPDEA